MAAPPSRARWGDAGGSQQFAQAAELTGVRGEDGDRAAAGTVVALHLRQKRTLEPAADPSADWRPASKAAA